NVLVVDLERWREGWVQDLDLVREDLDLATDQAGVDRALRARANAPRNRDDVFVAKFLCRRESGGPIRIADHLHESFAVAQIDENDAAMVAAPVHPAADGNGLAKSFAVDEPAIVGALQCFLRKKQGAAGCRQQVV